ncbi:Sperm-associated antigen 6 [Taenia solium]|eukprot:TsM_000193200 transcript=TsM_000193200 gene=TsM_000193200
MSDLANRPNNISNLLKYDVISCLGPLLNDAVPTIQQVAAIVIGKIASSSKKSAELVIESNMVPTMLKSSGMEHRFYKRSALVALQSIVKHSSDLALAVIRHEGLIVINACLEDFDQCVKENAASCLSCIVRHNEDLAQIVVDSGSLPLIILCLQEPSVNLRCISAGLLGDVAKHSITLAQNVVDISGIWHLKQAFRSLSQIAKHTPDFAELILEASIFPQVLISMKDKDIGLRSDAVNLIKELCKHTFEICQVVVNSGGVPAVVDFLEEAKGHSIIPGIIALGYVAAHSDLQATAIIKTQALVQLKNILCEETDEVKTAAVWAIGQIGRHSASHADAVSEIGLLPIILAYYLNTESSEDLKEKVLEKCTDVEALQSILHSSPPNILKYAVVQFSKLLPRNAKARRTFVVSGCLRKIQEIDAEPGSALYTHITAINNCFPEDVVKFYSPGYPEVLLERVEAYEREAN